MVKLEFEFQVNSGLSTMAGPRVHGMKVTFPKIVSRLTDLSLIEDQVGLLEKAPSGYTNVYIERSHVVSTFEL